MPLGPVPQDRTATARYPWAAMDVRVAGTAGWRWWRRSALLCAIILPLRAAEHHGSVKFAGLPVPGATVTAVQGEQKFAAVSDLQGLYAFPDLPEGRWTMSVEMLCFAPARRDVDIGPSTSVESWELKLLPLEEMHAEAQAPSPVLSVALAGKAPAANTAAAFQHTEPNASTDAAKLENEPEFPPTDEFKQGAAGGFLINGSVNNGASSPFALPAAFGNNRRGGRSLYNGGLGVTFDSPALDARAFSLTGQEVPKPAYNRLHGMASFGGPLQIPRVWTVNNAPFVTVNYQWTRHRNATTSSSLMPVAAEREGDFSQTRNSLGQPAQIFDPATGMPFAGNVIPQNRISSQARALLRFLSAAEFQQRRRIQLPDSHRGHFAPG